MGLLTPHKLFRKAMLDEHGIRFPEGRRRLEDHVFVVHSYFHAKRITVLAPYPCYHWMRSPDDVNASWRQFDPAAYFDNVREVLDLVDEHTEPGPLRDQMQAAWYRGKMLPRVGGSGFLRREAAYRRQLYEEVRRLVVERYDPDVMDSGLPFNLRVRAHLLRMDRYAALGELAEFESQLRADVTIRAVRDEIGKLVIELEAAIGGEREPLVLVRRGGRIEWLPPAALRKDVPHQALAVTGELEDSRVQVVLRSRRDESEYVVPTSTATVLLSAAVDGDGGEPKRPVLIARADVDRTRAAAGSRLPPGEWDVHVLVEVAGFSAFARTVRHAGGLRRRAVRTWTLMATWDERLLARPPLRRRAARRFPGVAGLVKRLRPRARGASV
jgi:hypothetical protein